MVENRPVETRSFWPAGRTSLLAIIFFKTRSCFLLGGSVFLWWDALRLRPRFVGSFRPWIHHHLIYSQIILTLTSTTSPSVSLQHKIMTVPHFINVFGERPALQVLNNNDRVHDQNIFRRVLNTDPKSRSLLCTSSWRPPLYRDTSLLSSPSRDSSDIHKENAENVVASSKLPTDFMPPKHTFSFATRGLSGSSSISSKTPKLPSKKAIDLHPTDVVCGRGAPTHFHPGNQAYRQLVKGFETAYLCAKRSEKPVIAMEIMDVLKGRGVRMVKKDGYSFWVEIGDQSAYEKVCQSLREGAPELRRQMLSACIVRKNVFTLTDD